MSKSTSSFLERYGQDKPAKGGTDYEALKAEMAEDFIKIGHKKKRTLVFLTEKNNPDNPFMDWGIHRGLFETSFWSVPCDETNLGTTCVVCNAIKDLKEEDAKLNEPFYKPIRTIYETYGRVVLMEDGEILDDKAYWFKVPRNIVETLVSFQKNLEEGEHDFYDRKHPQRLIIEFDDDKAPADKYSVTLKNVKESAVLKDKKIDELVAAMKPISYYFPSRTQENLNEVLVQHIERVQKKIEENVDADE